MARYIDAIQINDLDTAEAYLKQIPAIQYL